MNKHKKMYDKFKKIKTVKVWFKNRSNFKKIVIFTYITDIIQKKKNT